MNKRLRLQCWNCFKSYFETLDISDRQIFIVKCPYCSTEAVLDLKPYRRQPINVIRGGIAEAQPGEDLNIPDVLPTYKKE